ncbi:MAG: GTP-binding protein [Verrucomicrobiales bacterium]
MRSKPAAPAEASGATQAKDGLGKARYIMIGGFLGAGKTTCVSQLATYLTKKKLKVGLITNDQGQDLVDTAMLRARGFDTAEIQGGCFCCRFNSLAQAAETLARESRPDVFVAEPVGSCTDLIATVSYPLRRLYGNDYVIAPLSVVIDPVRALRIFGLEAGSRFSEKVLYIYNKQLEEAEVIVINKVETITPQQLQKIRSYLEKNFPHAKFYEVSARTGQGLETWFDHLLQGSLGNRPSMQVNYDTYAEGEALLGWLNCTVKISSRREFEAGKVLTSFARLVHESLAQQKIEIAHLKMTLNPDEDLGDIAVINLVRNDFKPELSQELPEPIESGEMIVNLRAEGAPDLLHDSVTKALYQLMQEHPTLFARVEHIEHFKPGKPEPTHRDA